MDSARQLHVEQGRDDSRKGINQCARVKAKCVGQPGGTVLRGRDQSPFGLAFLPGRVHDYSAFCTHHGYDALSLPSRPIKPMGAVYAAFDLAFNRYCLPTPIDRFTEDPYADRLWEAIKEASKNAKVMAT